LPSVARRVSIAEKDGTKGLNDTVDRRSLVLGGVAMATISSAAHAGMTAARTSVVETATGKIRGIVDRGVEVFRGIPYGESTGGAARFRPPRPRAPWTGVYDATSYGPNAPQPTAPKDMPAEERERLLGWLRVYGMPFDYVEQSEDCLFLNVWTPAVNDGRRRAVMFRIHGGGYYAGSGNWSWHDGTNLALQGDVVVVTVNHRLNCLGYLYFGDVGGAEYANANAGMMDLVLALQWVRDNIAAFGGDPDRVMIFGESGGGMKISTLLAMPPAAGLFHRAIIESGPSRFATTREEAAAYTRGFLDQLSIAPADFRKLDEMPIGALFKAQAAMGQGRPLASPMPCIDGLTLVDHPGAALAKGMSADIPLMIGTNLTEGTMLREPHLADVFMIDEATLKRRVEQAFPGQGDFLYEKYRQMWPHEKPGVVLILIEAGSWFRRRSIELAEDKLQGTRAPIYMYLLEWRSGAKDGMVMASHGIEAPLSMGNIETSGAWTAGQPGSRAVSNQMSATWIEFAKTGTPDNPTIPRWPPYEVRRRATMLFDVKSRIADDPYHEAEIWRHVPPSDLRQI
jgi:para-nitrobenzyl esterase